MGFFMNIIWHVGRGDIQGSAKPRTLVRFQYMLQKNKIMLELNEIKKDLYKSKEMAKFSHYVSGKMFYTVKIGEGTYQFPISTVETVERERSIDVMIYFGTQQKFSGKINEMILSEDLGTTTFNNEIRGSELIRWIGKAIKNEEFIKVG